MLWLVGQAAIAVEPPVGLWLSEQRSANGMGRTLEFSSDGRLRLSMGVIIGEQWVLQESRKKGDVVQIVDPSTGAKIRTVSLRVDEKNGQLFETDLDSDEELRMAFVSRGRQEGGPPFLGRWQFMLDRFGLLAVYEYTDDGWRWLRAPVSAEVGTYTIAGDEILPRWPGEYQPLVSIVRDGPILVATTAEGARQRFAPPKVIETLTPAPADPRR